MVRYFPKRIVIDNRVKDSRLTQTLMEKSLGIPVEYVDDPAMVIEEMKKKKNPLQEGKRVLLLTENRGRFLKPCPGTKEYICCGYQILNFATNCNMECSYCILQAYINNPLLIVYANTDEMFMELEGSLNKRPETLFRIGTGEFTDSLTLDHLISFSDLIVPYFAGKKNAVLELKTKTDNVENLLDLKHNGNTIIAWSLNTQEVAIKEELLAPSIGDRIDAALRCQNNGFFIAFHFDPLIYYKGWEEGYKRTLDRLFTNVNPKSVKWISMGCFRFLPVLKSIIQKRFPLSSIVYEEFVPGLDGKMRYYKPIRVEMYSKMVEWLKEYDPDLRVYLCMESHDVWKRVFRDNRIESSQDLARMLEAKSGYKREDNQKKFTDRKRKGQTVRAF